MSPVPLARPLGMTELFSRFVAEEATAGLRHDIRNRLTALRNGAFYVQRRLEKETELIGRDPRLLKFLTQIDQEAGAIAEVLGSRLPPVTEVAPVECGIDEVTAILESTTVLRAVELTRDDGALRVKGNAAELQVALFCLIENAAEAAGTLADATTRVHVRARDGWVTLEVDPGSDIDTAERLGLKISKRVAERWGGKLELSRSERGAMAALKLRAT